MNEMTKAAGRRHDFAEVGDVRLHQTCAGTGAPVLLHGWPQTSYAWRQITPLLVEAGHEVIAVDMRDAGDSSSPEGGYDSDAVAADLHALVRKLGLGKLRLVGHDNGGRVAYAYAYAARYREEVESLVFLESKVLGLESVEDVSKEFWHFGFHQEADLPELLLAGREREYLSYFYKSVAFDPQAITEAEIDEYVRCHGSLGGMRAGLPFYGAFPETGAQSRELATTKLTIPVLAYGGSHAMGEIPIRSMRRVAERVEGSVIEESGHWIPDEKPDWIAREIIRFHRSCGHDGPTRSSWPT